MADRRDFLKFMVGATMAPSLLERGYGFIPDQTLSIGAKPRKFLEPFNYRGVKLLDSRIKTQYQKARDFYFNIPDDDILRGFRRRAGLPAPGRELGGWYGGDSTLKDSWTEGDTFLTFGQWLSGMARMARATGDDAIHSKAVRLMQEWAKTIEPDGYFFYSRKPTTPHYAYEKMVCGLIDLYEYGECQEALSWLEKITKWAEKNLDRSRKPATSNDFASGGTEWYTLSENLYRAYQLTGNPQYKSFGDLWRYSNYWGMFTGGNEPSPFGFHAYSHVNTLSSAAMTYAVTGELEYLKTIVNAYRWLQRTQCYATGGYGPGEKLVPPDGALGRSLETEPNSFETVCGSWAGFKLGRYLMTFTGDATYGDWIERLVYNGVGASLPMSPDGKTFYYSDYRVGGGCKLYNLEWRWPCCAGTYSQAVADYYNLIYFKDPEGLYVNLFVPSEVTWAQQGDRVRLVQETLFPEANITNLTFDLGKPVPFALKVRVPGWADNATIRLNHSKLEIPCRPGTWATVNRTWSSGDRLEVEFPMKVNAAPVDSQHPNRVAMVYGPVVLVQASSQLSAPHRNSLAASARVDEKSLHFRLQEISSAMFEPFYEVKYRQTYRMYFDFND
jgi:hypothetical protein